MSLYIQNLYRIYKTVQHRYRKENTDEWIIFNCDHCFPFMKQHSKYLDFEPRSRTKFITFYEYFHTGCT